MSTKGHLPDAGLESGGWDDVDGHAKEFDEFPGEPGQVVTRPTIVSGEADCAHHLVSDVNEDAW